MGPVCPRHPQAAATATCERCGDHLCASCAAFGCDQDRCPQRVPVVGGDPWSVTVPWDARRDLGWVAAVAHTWRRSLLDPWRFFADLPELGRQPLTYGTVVGTLGLGLSLIGLAATRPELARPWLLLVLVALPAVMHLRLVLITGIGWFTLLILTGRREWERIVQITGYAASVDALFAVPGFGLALAGPVAGGLRALGLLRRLGVSPVAALVAGLAPAFAAGLVLLGTMAAWLWVTR